MDTKKILAIKDFIENAEKSVRNAKKLLIEILKEENIQVKDIDLDTSGLADYKSEDNKIIEGVFTGEEMLGADNHTYPVPANYASKSKLVQGDRLKLTIDVTGRMTYKQILPILRETKTGLVVKENGKYQVVSEGKTYNLLTAAVTHFKCEIGDNITILLPEGKAATFAAIEALIPKE
ncbi:MAG: hypothetical protein NWP80_01715 [Candidatus Gracilibacteria bacterium]|nr:hypothetical protein [Candidatus Gracilibacteria bacterium]